MYKRQGYGRYRFTVSDTGIGMSPEFVEHIFDPFERERTSTISGIQGTGLGMAITKNLVDMMHGTISVKSVKDKGTAFTIELTLQLAGEGDAAAAQEAKTCLLYTSNHLISLRENSCYNAPVMRRTRKARVVTAKIIEFPGQWWRAPEAAPCEGVFSNAALTLVIGPADDSSPQCSACLLYTSRCV